MSLVWTNAQKTAYEQSTVTTEDCVKCMLVAFGYFGIPDSLADIGCGNGHVVDLAERMGIKAWGCDICIQSRLPLYCCDLTEPLLVDGPVARPSDMCVCLEVAEHLPESAVVILCGSLLDATNDILLFSAATPGQGGSGHLNEQPHDYWRAKLIGFNEDVSATTWLRKAWSDVAPKAWWYGKNVIVFRKAQ